MSYAPAPQAPIDDGEELGYSGRSNVQPKTAPIKLGPVAAAQPDNRRQFSITRTPTGEGSSYRPTEIEAGKEAEPEGSPAPPPSERDPVLGSPQTREVMISVTDLRKEFNIAKSNQKVVALDGINLEEGVTEYGAFDPIRKGDFVMIRGPSGGGKTTLLNILGTLDYPTQGQVKVMGEVIDATRTDAYLANLRLRRIGFVFQTFNLISTMSAFENVELPMIIAGKLTRSEAKERAMELLDRVGLGDRLEHLPSELSGGEQQRVTIARALSNSPDILLLDEPTGDLDTKNTLEIMDLILEVNQKRNVTCVMVTHNPDLEVYASRILYVRDGKFVKEARNDKQQRINLEKYLKFIDDRAGL